jgi:hypothetical protein
MVRWLAALAGAFLALQAVPSNSAVELQEFIKPKVLKKLVDWCAREEGPCGKVAANLYCESVGYDGAASFSRAPVDLPTIYIDSGKTCFPGNDCEAITKVTCVRQSKKAVPLDPEDDEPSDEEDSADIDDGGGGETFKASPPVKLGGIVSGELTTARYSDKGAPRLAVFGKGTDNALWWHPGDGKGKWFGWAKIGGILKQSAACETHEGRAYCAVIGTDDDIYITGQSPGNASQWQPYQHLYGKSKNSPAVVSGRLNGASALFVFVRGLDGYLYYNAYAEDPQTDQLAWTGWRNTNRTFGGAPTCIRVKGDAINCYHRGGDRRIREHENVLGGGKVRVLDGETEKRPGVLRGSASGEVILLVRGLDGKLGVNRKYLGNWSGFTKKPYDFPGQPICHSMDDGANRWCFGIGGDGGVVTQKFPANAFVP